MQGCAGISHPGEPRVQGEDNSWLSSSQSWSLEQNLNSRQHRKKEFVPDPRLHQGCASFWHHHNSSPSIPQHRIIHSSFSPLQTQLPTPSFLLPSSSLLPPGEQPQELLLSCLWQWQFCFSCSKWNCATGPVYFCASLIAKCSIAPLKCWEQVQLLPLKGLEMWLGWI